MLPVRIAFAVLIVASPCALATTAVGLRYADLGPLPAMTLRFTSCVHALVGNPLVYQQKQLRILKGFRPWKQETRFYRSEEEWWNARSARVQRAFVVVAERGSLEDLAELADVIAIAPYDFERAMAGEAELDRHRRFRGTAPVSPILAPYAKKVSADYQKWGAGAAASILERAVAEHVPAERLAVLLAEEPGLVIFFVRALARDRVSGTHAGYGRALAAAVHRWSQRLQDAGFHRWHEELR